MEKLDLYREKCKKRLKICTSFLAISILVLFIGRYYQASDTRLGLYYGIALGLELVLLFQIYRDRNALDDDKLLEKMYKEEYSDEKQALKDKTRYPSLLLGSLIIFILSFILSFIKPDLSRMLAMVGLWQLVFALGLKIYWKRKL